MSKYPEGLLNWSGDKAGGVKKLFYKGSGRPSGSVITTGLLTRLQAWASDIAAGKEGTPRAIFLVGGPGNGKTEAVEFTIRELDAAMHLNGNCWKSSHLDSPVNQVSYPAVWLGPSRRSFRCKPRSPRFPSCRMDPKLIVVTRRSPRRSTFATISVLYWSRTMRKPT